MKKQSKGSFIQKMAVVCMVLTTIFLLNSSFKIFSKKNLSIIEYNVWNGFESQKQQANTFVQCAQKQNADIIAFEELNNFKQISFSEFAKRWGHSYAVLAKENRYPVGITCRNPITNVHKLMVGIHHGCLYAEINGISYFVVHFSSFSRAKRLQEADSVMHVLRQKDKLKESTIILSDFNAFSPHDSLFNAGSDTRDVMYQGQLINKVLQNLNSKDELDYQVIGSFLKSGFYDSFYLFHKSFEASYPSKVYLVPISEKIRTDYMLISENLKNPVKASKYKR
jgi:exodeoxyribonuclease-3